MTHISLKILLFLVFISINGFSRNYIKEFKHLPYGYDTIIDTSKDVKVPAEFPGGHKAWVKYLEKNMDYELPVRKGAPIGEYDVIVSFIISKDGSITNIKTENNPGYGMQDEVIRVIANSPKWNPASINGVSVIYRHRQSIRFSVFEK